jgi:hypothetical protein
MAAVNVPKRLRCEKSMREAMMSFARSKEPGMKPLKVRGKRVTGEECKMAGPMWGSLGVSRELSRSSEIGTNVILHMMCLTLHPRGGS